MNYRREIDGLRALAVLPVMCFHAGFSVFSGGFLGVDIFFVISGYLITGIIVNDIAQGSFSIARFYERRARRILPALFTVIFCTIPFAWMWMVPSHYESFSRSIIAVVLFLSNLFFWRESGYFAAEAAQKPLLHTWSLGVEEQFYVLFPLALLLIWRFGKRPTWAMMGLVGILSFVLCEVASRYAPSANFFLLPTRAWELMVGALCALHHHRTKAEKHHLLSLMGLGCILFALIAYGEHLRLPSAISALPVLGTALILLYATQETIVGRLLSLRLFVGIGLISYSAYLWHQPMFAFARITMVDMHDIWVPAVLILASLVLAAATWAMIEQPFRQKQHRFYVTGRKALRLAIGAACILLAIGAHGHLTHGRLDAWKTTSNHAQRRTFEMITHEQARDFSYDNGACVFNLKQLNAALKARIIACSNTYGAGIAVIGDSHAMNLFHVLRHKAGTTPFMVGLAQGMCRPDEPLATCNYTPFLQMISETPGLFHDVIYEQAGWESLLDREGLPLTQDKISGLSLTTAVPDFAANPVSIDAAKTYLEQVARYSRVTWLGPRIEPELSEHVIIQKGCDYLFALRPNQKTVFHKLDKAFSAALKDSTIHYQSQIDLMQLDMRKDFMNCDETYWKDRNHYSEAGEKRFGERITLKRVLGHD